MIKHPNPDYSILTNIGLWVYFMPIQLMLFLTKENMLFRNKPRLDLIRHRKKGS